MKRIAITILGLLGTWTGLLTLNAAEKPATAGRPNIVVILADDLGYGDLSCYGAEKIRTPRLDRLAAEGMRFTDFYVHPFCMPSRAALLTGCYPLRIAQKGNKNNHHFEIHDREMNIAEVLKQGGYATAQIGKWDVAGHNPKQLSSPELGPIKQGFDRQFGTPASNDRWNQTVLYIDGAIAENPMDLSRQSSTERYAGEAIRLIREWKDRPFFIYLAPNMPHVALDVSKAFEGKSPGGRYGDVIEELDHHIGRIVDALRAEGIAENTYLFFTSDNGPWIVKGPEGGSPGPFRGGKVSTWEGGVRVPAIAWAPGRIRPGQACGRIAASIDLLPTVAALAGVPQPKEKIDGRDLSSWLTGGVPDGADDGVYFYYHHTHLQGVRQGKWKLLVPRPARPPWLPAGHTTGRHIHDEDIIEIKTPMLIDLAADPGEKTDLSAKHPDVVKALLALSEDTRAKIGDYDRLGSEQRFFEPGPKRPDGAEWFKDGKPGFPPARGKNKRGEVAGSPSIEKQTTVPANGHSKLVPPEKNPDPAWVASLTAQGEARWLTGADLKWMGMPVGGIAAGQLYLGGDGKLWHWDIFNEFIDTGTGGPHYPRPLEPSSPLEQGFAIRTKIGGQYAVRRLDATGFPDIRFRGEYPIGRIEYRDPAFPVEVALEAFSPFVPLDSGSSSLPATILRYSVTNTGSAPAQVDLAGWLENAVGLRSGHYTDVTRTNRIIRKPEAAILSSIATLKHGKAIREPVVFETFDGKDFGRWEERGDSFQGGPKARPEAGEMKFRGQKGRVASSFGTGKTATGTLTSPEFTVDRNFIEVRIIGAAEFSGVHLLVDGQPVRTVGVPGKTLAVSEMIDAREFAGKTAHLQIFDETPATNIAVDEIIFRDLPPDASDDPAKSPDNGSLALAVTGGDGVFSSARIGGGDPAQAAFAGDGADEAALPFGQPLIGAVGRKLALAPGETAEVTFVLAWHFPFHTSRSLGDGSHIRRYAKRFENASVVADHVAENLAPLTAQTRLWVGTWYDSTLPFWFLDRTFATTSALATSTAQWFDDGRFWGWEGVGCCPGTCGHVWMYAQAMARLFPDLERWLRENVDFGVAMSPEGAIGFRGSPGQQWAVDAQAGYILRALREHRTSPDDAFLRRVYPRMKKAMQFLISRDTDGDGILDGPQHNTLDGEWFGKISWLSSLYLAALHAAEVMAEETGDTAFAAECRERAAQSRASIESKLFNGEYFIQTDVPEDKMEETGSFTGSHIDQVAGQAFAFQIGLGRILDEAKTRSALSALYKYNFAPDVGPYRAVNKPGRPYALPGEGGLIMTTWPMGDSRPKGTFAGYLNECMTGFEYQAAGHMIAEGLVTEGLAVTRAIHDRYHPSKRNPYNEIEAGDHYARSMASYGVFLAACGFEYDGPNARIGFDPRITPDNFRAAFTAAEGWGTLTQNREARRQTASLAVKWGHLRLSAIDLVVPKNTTVQSVRATLAGKMSPASVKQEGSRVRIALAPPVDIPAGAEFNLALDLGN